MKLYLIRHGQTDWNIEQRIQGQQDIPLNDTGRAQARCLTQAMKEKKLDAIYTSPQIRAYATAGAVAGDRPIPVVTLPWLMEINYGDWEGKTAKELLKKDGDRYKAWWDRPAEVAPPGGETVAQVDARCAAAWDWIRSRMKGDTAIVSHGGLLAHFMEQLLKGSGEDDGGERVVHNASITTFEYQPETGEIRLTGFDECGHLRFLCNFTE